MSDQVRIPIIQLTVRRTKNEKKKTLVIVLCLPAFKWCFITLKSRSNHLWFLKWANSTLILLFATINTAFDSRKPTEIVAIKCTIVGSQILKLGVPLGIALLLLFFRRFFTKWDGMFVFILFASHDAIMHWRHQFVCDHPSGNWRPSTTNQKKRYIIIALESFVVPPIHDFNTVKHYGQ